ncbi:MAG: hypothetical protein IKE23_11840 [Exiguobacterium sp.]|nr:hypothetical protein [Exiguobacterium sp.]
MASKHPSELYADFRQYYGVDFDKLRGEIGEIRTADLAAQLPSDSRSFRAVRPELTWTDRDYMLWSIEFSLRVLRWQPTKDGQAGRNKPRPLPTPADRARVVDKIEATDMKAIADALGIDLDMEGVDG